MQRRPHALGLSAMELTLVSDGAKLASLMETLYRLVK
jgi:hypothetical protein